VARGLPAYPLLVSIAGEVSWDSWGEAKLGCPCLGFCALLCCWLNHVQLQHHAACKNDAYTALAKTALLYVSAGGSFPVGMALSVASRLLAHIHTYH
jgi:hypothetical protein